LRIAETEEGGRHARTCLEYTFACDAHSLCAKADAAKGGAVDELQDSIWSIFCLTSAKLGSSDGRGGNATESITLRASDGRSDIRIQICRDNRSNSGHGGDMFAPFSFFSSESSSSPALQISVMCEVG